jgi:aryl-alcohol dehydrogenase-like predicted oxidoreductase
MSSSVTIRSLGASGLQVHPLCLGGNVFGWTVDGDAAFEVLDAYLAAGGNFIDSADAYSAWVDGHAGGESERLLGAWLAGRPEVRDDVVLATKVGWLGGLGRDAIRRGVEASLERLGVERIDLYYAHKDDPATPLDETLEALDGLVAEGLVRTLGASNYSAARLAEALAISERNGWARFEVLQPGLNLVSRAGYDDELQRLCAEHDIGVVPYAALASGFLTGKYGRDGSGPTGPRAGRMADRSEEDCATLDAVREVAARHDAEPAAVAVAWVLAQPAVASAIASATRPDQLDALLQGAALELSEEDLDRLV